MAYFDDHPQLFRLLFGILLVYLFGLAGYNFYRYASSPTDENWYANSPSRIYVTKSFPAQYLKQYGGLKTRWQEKPHPDSIVVGDLWLAVNGQKFDSLHTVSRMVQMVPSDSTFEVNIFRPAADRFFIYRVTKSAVPDSFYRSLPPTACVFDVFKDGASDRAGMKVGDLILRVNGYDLKSYGNAAGEADRFLRLGQIGKTIIYEVIRDNRVVTLQVTLARFGVAIPLLIMCLSGLVYIGAGAFMALQRPHLKAARLLGLAFLFMGFYLAVTMMQRPEEFNPFTVTRGITLSATLLFGIAVWCHSGFYFPKERPELLAKRWLSYVPYLFALIGFAMVLLAGPRGSQKSLLLPVLAVLTLSLIYIAVISFIYRKQCPAERKRLSRLIKWTGITVGVATAALSILLDRMQIGYIGLSLVLLPLAYLYTIGRYRLLDMDLRVRRNVQYTFVSLVWSIFILVVAIKILLALPKLELALPNLHLTGTSIEILDSPMVPEQQQLLEKGVLMLIAIGLTFAFWQIGRAGQKLIAQKFYRKQFDYRRAASELAEVMATKLSMVDLSRGIVQKLAELMQLKRAGVLFFRDQNVCCCQEASGFGGKEWEDFCLRIDQRFFEVMHQFRSESRFSVDYLPQGMRESFQQHGLRHIIPIRFKEKLVGTLLIGEKLSESPFYNDDLIFLSAVAKQASVAIENAFLYEELAEQERLKHELAIARRIQLASLPQTTPKVPGLDIAGISIPAMEVGGDYYDFLNDTPNEIRIIVGDVSGKGTSAALYMSKVQGILRSLHSFGLSPRELFIRANQLLCQDLEKKSFITSLGADFDTQLHRLVLARAGHLPLFYYHAKTQQVEKITPKGLGLGLESNGAFAAELEEKVVQYETGDVFLFATDGVTEAQSRSGGEFGEDSLVKILENHASGHAGDIRDQVIAAVTQFVGDADPHDDQTVVVVKAI
ncbi:MAG: SpoIIE family protein phosphatase [candidate division KSB1 bacterium]|nr:SpoIIE family protein phosphatase [candidate division KSB1 bacterium]MDZ7303963.1 SpoIIE family protein phosphatase [candidate division KSB1 bacterium]MDZ7313691.1 SpoIIE family protein phosphatase [candidate division KSB1 bacterium]